MKDPEYRAFDDAVASARHRILHEFTDDLQTLLKGATIEKCYVTVEEGCIDLKLELSYAEDGKGKKRLRLFLPGDGLRFMVWPQEA